MRITPYFRTPCSFSTLAMRQAFFTASTNFSRSSGPPCAVLPTVPGQTGATSEPTASPPRGNLICDLPQLIVADIDRDVRIEKEEIDSFKLLPACLSVGVNSIIRSRLIGGSSVPGVLPTRPGHVALCSFGKVLEEVLMWCD
jgi:hypothetical protein